MFRVYYCEECKRFIDHDTVIDDYNGRQHRLPSSGGGGLTWCYGPIPDMEIHDALNLVMEDKDAR